MLNVFNQSIWGDEGFSAILSMKSVPQILSIISHDTSPPLWNLLEHFAFQIFGVSEQTIRGLSLAFFLLTGVFVFLIVKSIWNKKTAAFALLLTYLNPFFFIYAFEGRMYSIMALGVTASMYFFLKRKWVPYVIATLWALYSHHFAIFAVFLQGLWFLYELIFGDKKLSKKMFKSFIAVGIGYIPWMIPLYNQTKMVGGGFWLGTPTANDLRNLIYEYLAEGNKSLGLTLPFVKTLALHQIALYLTFAILVLRKWHKNIKNSIFFILWFLGPIILTWVVSQKFQSIFFDRYLLYTIPAAMILLATNKRKFSTPLIAILLLVFAYTDFFYFTHPTKLPFKELSTYVLQSEKPGDYLINWNSSAHHLWETKFYGIPAPIYIPGNQDLPYFVGTALMEKSDIISSIPETAQRFGVVTSGSLEEINLPGYTELEAKNFNGLKVVWYQKD